MSTQAIVRLPESVFNYQKFQADLTYALDRAGDNINDVSAKVLFRSPSYLHGVIANRTLPMEMAFALCAKYGLSMKDYEIKKEPKPLPPPAVNACPLKNGWDCVIRVNPDTKVALMTIYKDGAALTSSRSRIRGKSDLEIMQSISYAAHMCYKNIEQKALLIQDEISSGG